MSVENAIKSLYQMILAVDFEASECRMMDLNPEFGNFDREVSGFREFCDLLYINAHPEDRERIINFCDTEYLRERLSRNVYISMECRLRHADRSYFWSEIVLCNATREDEAGGSDFLLLIHDIHDRKTHELRKEAEIRLQMMDLSERYEELFIENMTDQQTGCYNRKGMKYYTDIVIKDAALNGRHLFVCVADLNGLKHLNDTYGHAAGDEAIAAVSSELKKSAPEGARIVRTGGDEFLIMAAIDKDSTEPDSMGEKIDRGLKEYNLSHDNPFDVGVSYGWVVMPPKEGMDDLDEYIAVADERMYEMKTRRDEYRRQPSQAI